LSTIALGFRLGSQWLRKVALGLASVALIAGAVIFLTDNSFANALKDRTAERGPVEVRMAVYGAAWSMFLERPITGWTAGGMYFELAHRMPGYHLSTFYVHNTYLSLLIEFRAPGLLLYLMLFFNLFRLGRIRGASDKTCPLLSLRRAWPILLCVYLFNAFFVDMAYQFVIGLMFTVAGMLCSPQEAAA